MGRRKREKDLQDNMGADLVLKECLKHITKFDCAIDGGAHTGYVTQWMAARFQETYAFEPGAIFDEIPRFRSGVHLIRAALGDRHEPVDFLCRPETPRSAHVVFESKKARNRERGLITAVDIVTIDSLGCGMSLGIPCESFFYQKEQH